MLKRHNLNLVKMLNVSLEIKSFDSVCKLMNIFIWKVNWKETCTRPSQEATSHFRAVARKKFWLRQYSRLKLWLGQCPWLNSLPRYLGCSTKKHDWGKCLGLPHTGYGPALVWFPCFTTSIPNISKKLPNLARIIYLAHLYRKIFVTFLSRMVQMWNSSDPNGRFCSQFLSLHPCV